MKKPKINNRIGQRGRCHAAGRMQCNRLFEHFIRCHRRFIRNAQPESDRRREAAASHPAAGSAARRGRGRTGRREEVARAVSELNDRQEDESRSSLIAGGYGGDSYASRLKSLGSLSDDRQSDVQNENANTSGRYASAYDPPITT